MERQEPGWELLFLLGAASSLVPAAAVCAESPGTVRWVRLATSRQQCLEIVHALPPGSNVSPDGLLDSLCLERVAHHPSSRAAL